MSQVFVNKPTEIKEKTVEEMYESFGGNPEEFIILNDGETFTSLKGCSYVDYFGTIWNLEALIQEFIKRDQDGHVHIPNEQFIVGAVKKIDDKFFADYNEDA